MRSSHCAVVESSKGRVEEESDEIVERGSVA